MIHPHTRLAWISDTVGWGVVATHPIPAGTLTWVPDPLDRRISRTEFAALPAVLQTQVAHFAYLDQAGNHVLAWDIGRYINHSCAPTCVSGGYDGCVAAVDLQPGEQLTDDYGSYLPGEMDCACGAATCRRRIGRSFAPALIATWDERFAAIFQRIGAVDQPLWEVLPPSERARLAAALAGREPPASIATFIGSD